MTVTFVTVKRWVDGDTLVGDLHVAGTITLHNVSLRLKGVDCPELKGVNRLKGMRAREFVKKNYPQGTVLEIEETFPVKDRHGRWLITAKREGVDIAQLLIENKLGIPVK